MNMRSSNARSSADPRGCRRYVTGRLLDLSHVSWRTYVADQLADHRLGTRGCAGCSHSRRFWIVLEQVGAVVLADGRGAAGMQRVSDPEA